MLYISMLVGGLVFVGTELFLEWRESKQDGR